MTRSASPFKFKPEFTCQYFGILEEVGLVTAGACQCSLSAIDHGMALAVASLAVPRSLRVLLLVYRLTRRGPRAAGRVT